MSGAVSPRNCAAVLLHTPVDNVDSIGRQKIHLRNAKEVYLIIYSADAQYAASHLWILLGVPRTFNIYLSTNSCTSQ